MLNQHIHNMPIKQRLNNLHSTFTKSVALPGLSVIVFISVFCGFFPQRANHVLNAIKNYFFANLSWVYVIMVSLFILFLIIIAMSKLGNIRLGANDSQPKYSFFSWISMLFAAGMGIGLMYFGVAETIAHYAEPAISDTVQRAKEAQLYTFFHWGIHAWGIYAVMGLILAYFAHRYNLPLAIRSGLYPLLKEKINGPIGHTVDVFALCSTFFGIITTLGFGVMQLNAGLVSIGLVPESNFGFQAAIVVVVTSLAVISTLTGLDKGVKFLSEFNIGLAIVLMVFVLLLGPTLYILSTFSEGLGYYISNLPRLTFNTFAYESEGAGWFSQWTILYWAWWIAWAPYVGLFIARISKGRTIREYIVAVLLVPSLFNFAWMTIFGSSAVWFDKHVVNGAFSALSNNPDILLFEFFKNFPLTSILSIIVILMISVFFITSADSGILVMNSIASGDKGKSPKWQNIFWGGGLICLSLALLRTGGLESLQTMTLIASLPFGMIMLVLCYGLWKALKLDFLYHNTLPPYGSESWDGKNWRKRLDRMFSFYEKKDVRNFLATTVREAFEDIQEELKKKGITAEIRTGKKKKVSIELLIRHDVLRNFRYGVSAESQTISPYFVEDDNTPDVDMDDNKSYIPVTYFTDGRSGNNIQYLTKDEIIADVLKEYERYISLASDTKNDLLNIEI